MGMTRKQAIRQLAETGMLTTETIRPLGISSKSLLCFEQVPRECAQEVITKLLKNNSKRS